MDEQSRVAPDTDKGGAWVQMGGREYKVAPLNFKALRTLQQNIAVLAEVVPGVMPNSDQMGVLVQLAHAALARNYPKMTEDEVADMLDFGNFSAVLSAVMGSATMKEPPKGEALASP
jgi:hypothetical protein